MHSKVHTLEVRFQEVGSVLETIPGEVRDSLLQGRLAELTNMCQSFQAEVSSSEWLCRYRQLQSNHELIQRQIPTMAQAIHHEMLEKLSHLGSQQREQLTTILKQLQGLCENEARRASGIGGSPPGGALVEEGESGAARDN